MLVILPLSGTILKSENQPGLTERAVSGCGDRLGILACIWAIYSVDSDIGDVRISISILNTSSSTNTFYSRHQYPSDMYVTWASPGPLNDLLPQSTVKRTSAAISIELVPGHHRMALPPLSQTKHYSIPSQSIPICSPTIRNVCRLIDSFRPQFDVYFPAPWSFLVYRCYLPTT